MKVARLLALLAAILSSGTFLLLEGQTTYRNSTNAELCHTAPERLEHGQTHILRGQVLSSKPTDRTYADEGYGEGEFDTVKLLGVISSPIKWTPGLVFRVHPFQGKRGDGKNLPPEHLIVGRRYYFAYTYGLAEEPNGSNDLIGLSRCAVHKDTPADGRLLLDALRR